MARFVLTAELSLQAPRNVAQVVQQIQSQLNGVQVNVQVQGARQAQRDVEQLARSADRANDSFFRMGRTFTASIRRFSALAIATRAVSLLTNTLGSAIEEAISFQNEVVRLSQVTGDSISKLSGLTNEITSLATTLGVSSDKLLSVTTILAQAGLTASDTRVALAALAKTELAPTFGNITETAEGAIAILAQFKLGAGALEAQLGSLNAVSGRFAVESGDLVEVIRRTGGVFKSAGGDLNELIALFTSVRATTRESASTIATGLRTIFTRIQRPKTIEYLKQYGVELVDLEGKFVGPFEAVKRLSEALAGLEEGDITFVQIAEQLGGFRQIGKVIPLLREFALSQEALKVAQEGTGSLTRDQATAQLSLAVQITKVKEQFFALVRGFTETSTFRVMADVILKLASTFIRLAEAIQPILPIITAFAGIRLAQGIGGLIGGVLGRARGMSQGGKVLGFAKGGLVPGSGSGTADDIPAMVSSGEFVMQETAVKRIGVDNLEEMNSGGNIVQKLAFGGKARKFGIASLSPIDKPLDEAKATIPISNIRKYLARKPGGKKLTSRGNIENTDNTIRGILGLKGQQSIKTSAVSETISRQDVSDKIEKRVESSIQKLIDNAATVISKSLSINVARKADNATVKSVGSASTIGSIFEGALSTLGAPMDTSKSEQDPIDFPNGLGTNLGSAFQSLAGIPVDAKKTATKDILKKTAYHKASNYLANAVYSDPTWATFSQKKQVAPTSKSSSSRVKSTQKIKPIDPTRLASFNTGETYNFTDIVSSGIEPSQANQEFEKIGGGMWRKKHLGGIIQKFAIGGRAKGIQDAPLVDDILQASGSILPRPTKAIQDLIKAGGGAVDIDRTLKRTVGDTAYAKAPTPEAKDAALNTYFRDEKKRLNDLKIAPITQFGTELQAAIKNGQLNARKISIISKSKRVKGAAEYLSSLFGIPVQNMIFTQGGSKQPAIDAIRTKGSRVDRVKKFSGGLIQKFAQGGTPSPLDSLQEYYADAAPMNLGLADSKNLGKDQRQKLASNVRGLRKLRTPAPATLYSSISRVAFDKMASQVGFNKAPTIPEGTKYNDIEKILDKEAKSTVGKSFNLPGFVSTSKDYAKAKTFLDNAPRASDNWAAMLTIATKANAQGVDVEKQLSGRQLNISKQDINPRTGKMETMYMKPPSSEEEVILQPRSRFRINEARAVKLGAQKNLWATAQQFASGGVVPGVGNRDTIPAMLNEGDFVIRKSSTQNIGTDVLSSMAGYAEGGSVSKGVPALLTPGEWVFDQKQAQNIGYGKLNKMNKVGKYATGGYVGVQKFAGGTSGRGAKSADMPFEAFVAPNLSKVEVSGIKLASTLDKLSMGTLSKIMLAGNSLYSSLTRTESENAKYQRQLNVLSTTFPNFANIIKNNATANQRSTASQMALTDQIFRHMQVIARSTSDETQARTEINNAMHGYADALAQNTVQLTNSGKASPLSPIDPTVAPRGAPIGPVVTSPTPPTTSPPIPPAGFRPMGSPGSLPVMDSGPSLPPAGFRPMGSPGSLPSMGPTVTPATFPSFSRERKAKPGPSDMGFGSMGGSMGQKTASQESTATNKGILGLGAMTEGLFATQMALSYLTPVVDENSSTITRMTASLSNGLTTVISTVMAVNGALQLFGITLNKQSITDIFSGKNFKLPTKFGDTLSKGIQGMSKSNIKPIASVGKSLSTRLGGSMGSMGGSMGQKAIATGLQSALTPAIQVLGKFAAVTGVAFTAFAALSSIMDSTVNYQGQANEAIQKGNASKAGEMAVAANVQEQLNTMGYAAIAAGAAIGGPFGAAVAAAAVLTAKAFPMLLRGAGDFASEISQSVGSLGSGLEDGMLKDGIDFASLYLQNLGENLKYGAQSIEWGLTTIGVAFGGQTYDSIVAVAEAAALETQSKKALIEMEKQATQAMKEFTDGNISAYEALQRTADTTQTVVDDSEATVKANKEREGDKAVGILAAPRNIASSGLGGLFGLIETSAQRNKKIDEENKGRTEANVKRQEQAIETSQPMTDSLARATAASGGDLKAFKANLESANPSLFKLYTTLDPTGKRMAELERRFGNLQAEAEKTRKAFQAMNLGFQSVDATASAMTVGLDNYLAAQEAGNIGLTQSMSTLQAGLTNAAQGITTEAFQSALTDAEVALKDMGAGGAEVDKFKENMTAINTAQKFYAGATEEAKKSLQEEFKRGASGSANPKTRQQALSDALTSQLEGAGISDEVRKRIGEAVAGAEIKDTDLEAIINGNFEVLDKVLKDLGDKTFGQVSKSLEQYAKYQQQLVKLTQERIQVEGKLRDAQKSTIDATLEAAKIAQEFGGAAVTPDQNRKAIIDKANIDAKDLGVGELKTGSAAEIKVRQENIRQTLERKKNVVTQAAAGDKGAQKVLQGQSGAERSADTERLKQLAQENYNTTKALIDQKREEIKLIQSKNQLEKDSMDALISGDIMKFFDSQAAIGAQAALATGDQQLISQFDTASLGAATKDLERQKEAGVQQKFGRDIGGSGGLVEGGYSAIGGRVGLSQDSIQAAAQTTPEQLQAEKEARELAGTLPENMSILEMSADKDLEAAKMQIQAAEDQLKAARGEVEKSAAGPVKPVGALARGGTVYASRGTFVNFKPKGTDTVPAMLTPGEFVVRRQSVQRGNNLAILTAMNKGQTAPSATGTASGMSKGGQVKYMNAGGIAPQGTNSGVSINVDVQALKSFSESLSKFNSDLATNIQNLKDTQFKISLSPTNINVNLTGTSFLEQLTSSLKQELISYVGSAISQYTVGSDGKLKKSGSTLGTGL